MSIATSPESFFFSRSGRFSKSAIRSPTLCAFATSNDAGRGTWTPTATADPSSASRSGEAFCRGRYDAAVAKQVGQPDGEIVLRELLAVWERLGKQRTSVPREVDAIRHATLVHGLAAHAAQLSNGALALMEQGLWVPTYPLVRLILEDAILVEWLESERGSWRELLRRSAADLIRLVDQIAEHGTLTSELTRFRVAAEANLSGLGGRPPAASRVERQMTDLAGAGKSLYTNYRILSQYCHAGKPVVDLYSIEDDATPGGGCEPSATEVRPGPW